MTRTTRIVLRTIFAIFYTLVYGFCAVIAAGAGHGTVLFLLPFLTWLFSFVAFVFLDQFQRRTFVVLMVLHYSFLLLLAWVFLIEGLDPNDIKYWNSEPGVVTFSTIVYVSGQVSAWVAFAINRAPHKV